MLKQKHNRSIILMISSIVVFLSPIITSVPEPLYLIIANSIPYSMMAKRISTCIPMYHFSSTPKSLAFGTSKNPYIPVSIRKAVINNPILPATCKDDLGTNMIL